MSRRVEDRLRVIELIKLKFESLAWVLVAASYQYTITMVSRDISLSDRSR